jgi:hypothetical protein
MVKKQRRISKWEAQLAEYLEDVEIGLLDYLENALLENIQLIQETCPTTRKQIETAVKNALKQAFKPSTLPGIPAKN